MRSGFWINWDYGHSSNGEKRWVLLFSNSCNLLIRIGETLGTLKSGCKKKDSASKLNDFEHLSEYVQPLQIKFQESEKDSNKEFDLDVGHFNICNPLMFMLTVCMFLNCIGCASSEKDT